MATKDRIEGTNFLEGKLLIALPGMSDPRFEKTVIFMCAHSQTGAMGLIINKPVAGLGFHAMMQKLGVRITANTPDFPVLFGGPVETGRGFVLHSADFESNESTLPVSEDVSLTATLDILRTMAEGRGPQKAIFALGYAGWGLGQLEGEIARKDWFTTPEDPDMVFAGDSSTVWDRALARRGREL